MQMAELQEKLTAVEKDLQAAQAEQGKDKDASPEELAQLKQSLQVSSVLLVLIQQKSRCAVYQTIDQANCYKLNLVC